MREHFDHNAAFLTPIALLTSAQMLADGEHVTSIGSKYHTRMQVAKLAVYYPILLRWDEMTSFAKVQTQI